MSKQKWTTQNSMIVVGVALLVSVAVWSLVWPYFAPAGVSEINTLYGRRRSRARTSVNGTSVFSEMFRRNGAKVSTWTQLSPRLRRSQTVVWTPNSFELPTAKELDYFDKQWLQLEDGEFRTLIYVARDYDASIQYWQSQAENTTGRQFLKSQNQAARARSQHDYARSLTGREMDCDWFSVENSQRLAEVQPSKGEWAEGLDREATRLSAAGKLQWPEDTGGRNYEVLLGSDETPLIVRITDEYDWPDGQVIVCLNGSSILNLPLVNHANRKIAMKLIAECQDPKRVTFLESDAGGVTISNSDPKAYSGFDALTQWPINSPFLHLVVAGILFCAMVFPIFGRPRTLDDDTPSNFGKHIRAMGELLALSRDRETAMAKIKQYRNLKIEPLTVDAPTPSRQESGNPFKVSEV